MAVTGQLSKAVKGIGTKLYIGDGASPEVFTAICDVTSIKQTGAKFDEVETTHLNSIEDSGVIYKEFMLGIKDPGSYDLELNFTMQDGQDKLLAAEGARKNFRLDFPQLVVPTTYTNGLRLSFAALVNAVLPDPDIKGVIKASCNLRVSGAVVKSAIPGA